MQVNFDLDLSRESVRADARISTYPGGKAYARTLFVVEINGQASVPPNCPREESTNLAVIRPHVVCFGPHRRGIEGELRRPVSMRGFYALSTFMSRNY